MRQLLLLLRPNNLKPGTLIVIKFENGTTKVVRSSSTNVLPVTGGYLVVDPLVIQSQPLPAKTISKSVVNQFYTAIAFVIDIIESPLPPSPLPPPTEPIPPEPLPYCDTPEAEGKKSCHDIDDVDQVIGLFPCNDGSQATNKEDCPGYTEPEPEPEPEPDPGNSDDPVDSGVDEGNTSEEEVS